MKYLSYVLYPLSLGFSVYSLMYKYVLRTRVSPSPPYPLARRYARVLPLPLALTPPPRTLPARNLRLQP